VQCLVAHGLAMITDKQGEVTSKLKTNKDDLLWFEMHIKLEADKNKWELSEVGT
jgi:hypothetical protein